jgi:hypothetical protein
LDREIPGGKDVSNLFPWWLTGVIDLGIAGATPANGQRFSFAPGGIPGPIGAEGQRRGVFLKNDQPGPVAITEVRWWSNQPFAPENPLDWQGDFLDGMAVQMETDLQQGLVEEWIPVKALHTQEDQLFLGNQWAGVVRLPTPYYLQAQQQFGIRVRVRHDPGPNDFGPWAPETFFDVQLRGKDPLTGIPTSYDKLIQVPPIPVGGAFSLEQDFYFDDDRDAPIRDLILTDIAFGDITVQTTTPLTQRWLGLDPIEIKFLPPTGPGWTKDVYTHLAQGLFENVGSSYRISDTIFALRRPVIHRPKRPYVLRPGDSFRIHAMWDYFLDKGVPTGCGPQVSYAAEGGKTLIFCRISGVQEGTNA